jgi:hypothetical protein
LSSVRQKFRYLIPVCIFYANRLFLPYPAMPTKQGTKTQP